MKRLHLYILSVLLPLIAAANVHAECLLTLQRIAEGLNRPVGIACPKDGSGRLFILEQFTGAVKILDLNTNTILPKPFLTITGLAGGNEQGLLGITFHPDYANNGYFYVNVTVPGGLWNNGLTQIRRYQVSEDDPNSVAPRSMAVILSYDQPYSNHNAGWMDFGPDGYLYIAAGDGGSGFDPGNRAQSLTTLLGKILRIDVDGTDGVTGLYGIPADNPFVDIPNARHEIWAYGLRNPWRCSFDRETGDLYIGDVGQGQMEEIDFQPAESIGGENYGWRIMEGTLCNDNSLAGGNPPCNDPSLVNPIYEYPHPVGFSVIGGYAYRGKAIGDLQGTYFFADYATVRIWSLRYDGNDLTDFRDRTAELDPNPFIVGFISSFGQDEDGELYLLDMSDGEVYKIVSAEEPIAADLDHNCVVDFQDLVLYAEQWIGQNCGQPDWCQGMDLDQSGEIDLQDFAIFLQDLLNDMEPPAPLPIR